MNQLGPQSELALVRAIVERHDFPDVVSSFDVRLGEFDDEPAVFITFDTRGEQPGDVEHRRDQAKKLFLLRQEVFQDLWEHFPQRYPYFNFTNSEHVRSSAE